LFKKEKQGQKYKKWPEIYDYFSFFAKNKEKQNRKNRKTGPANVSYWTKSVVLIGEKVAKSPNGKRK